MRVGVDIQSIAGGRGPARFTTEILKALSVVCDPRDRFFLYSPFEKGIDGLSDNFIFKLVPLKRGRPWLNWTLAVAARRDKVDVMFFPANDFWVWRVTPTVTNLLDVAPATNLFKYLPSRWDRLQNRLQMKRLAKVTDKVLTISRFSAYSIAAYLPEATDKLKVVYCGLSSKFQRPENRNSTPPSYVLFVGGFDRRKNLERLLQAYKLLLAREHREKLFLVGSAGQNRKLYYDMPELIKTYDLENHVEIKSGVDDDQLAQLYASARILVMPSIIEGFGLPVLEAMACGCPVACSNVASLPEVGGHAAHYFDPYNIQEMADCMERVLTSENLRQEMIAKGLEQVKKFSWLKAGEQVYEVLQKVASNKS
jgi:glycosyltransferase involved in cell wall biosynthesis